MADDVTQTDPSVETTQEVQAPAPVEAPTQAPSPSRESVLTIPTSAMKGIKAEERERGRKSALDDLNAQASSLGYESFTSLMQAAADAAKGASAPQRQSDQEREADEAFLAGMFEPEAVTATGPDIGISREEVARLVADKRRLNRARARSDKQNRKLQRALEQKEVEMTLRTAAVRAGVQDVDYAMTLLRRNLQGKTQEELNSFDENDYFASTLKEQYPYLYGVASAPATTSPAAAQVPPRVMDPTPGKQEGATDARTLTRDEYDNLLAQHGLVDPSLTF